MDDLTTDDIGLIVLVVLLILTFGYQAFRRRRERAESDRT